MRRTRDLINTLSQRCQITDRLVNEIILKLKSLEVLERQHPLFLPLIGAEYDAFKSGEKTEESRRYGRRWNEKICYPGREVMISYGFCKVRRMLGVIKSVKRVQVNMQSDLSDEVSSDIKQPHSDILIVSIDELQQISTS